MSNKLQIEWQNRFDVLEPTALLVFDETAVRLKEKLLLSDDEKLAALQGVFAENMLFLTGKPENLPWIDGVIYLGKDALAPSIFLPTNVRPAMPVDLFEKVLLKSFSAQLPLAVFGNKIISIGKMLPVSRKILSGIFVNKNEI